MVMYGNALKELVITVDHISISLGMISTYLKRAEVLKY